MPITTASTHHGATVLAYTGDAPLDTTGVIDLLGDAMACQADWVTVAADRLDPQFFRLRTGVAGEIAQKFVNYRTGLAIIGDITEHLAASTALRDFVAESNRRRQLWFEPDTDAFLGHLGRVRKGQQ